MSRPTTIAALTSVVLLSACARRSASVSTTVTSARIDAGHRAAESAAEAVTLGKYNEALARADSALALAPTDAWATYDRAVALQRLGRPDEAVAAYRAAEARLRDDPWGKSVAIYGRARAFDDVGRCEEAKAAYREYAAFVRAKDPRAADLALAYAGQCQASSPIELPGDPVLTEMANALAAGRYEQVVAIKERTLGARLTSPWVDYDLGAALTGLGQTDAAVEAYKRAEQKFGDDPGNLHGRSVALWGRARALEIAQRCVEAKTAYDAYAVLVGATDPSSARLAVLRGRQCK